MGAPEHKIFSPLIPQEHFGGAAASWEFQPLDGKPVSGNGPLTDRDKRAYLRGLEQGRREGFAAATAQRAQHAQAVTRVLADLRARFVELESDGADALLDLALEIARQVVRQEVQVRRDAVLPVLREAVTLVIDQQAHPRVHLNPKELELIRGELEADGLFKGCRFIPDAQLAHGSCRVETGLGEIDGRLANRWRRVVKDAMGVDDAWFEETQDGSQ